MTYEQFLEDISFVLRREIPSETKIELKYSEKNNGRVRKGFLFDIPGKSVYPTIYMEEFYDAYLRGETMEKVQNSIVKLYDKMKEKEPFQVQQIFELEQISDKIVYRLINKEKNQHLLRGIPYMDYLDFAITFYVLIDSDWREEHISTMQITNEHLKLWGIQMGQLWKLAHRNTEELLPSRFQSVVSVINQVFSLTDELLIPEDDTMYMLTNELKCFGASVILYEDLLEEIGDIFGENYYILPSSIHEVLIVKESKMISLEDVNEMIQEVNENQVDEDEILSDHAYYYSREKNILTSVS